MDDGEEATESGAQEEAGRLSELLANGVARRFDLAEWCSGNRACEPGISARERAKRQLEQCRPDGVKLVALSDTIRLTGGHGWDGDLLYGEVELDSFFQMLDHVSSHLPHPGERTFVDAGCGSGKALVAAGASGHFMRCVGIEKLPSVAAIATIAGSDFAEAVVPKHGELAGVVIEVEEGDVLERASRVFADADCVFLNCATWSEGTLGRVSAACDSLQPGALVIAVLAELENPNLVSLSCLDIRMSWGHSEALLYRRA